MRKVASIKNMISLPQKPKIIKNEGNRTVFEIENLYPGYGVTLGNALRRVLLSSLPGAAIVAVKIKGAHHEFSTIPHVAEDVIEIILNLRQVRFKKYIDEPVKLILSVKGEKEIKAGDIKTTSDIDIINKEAPIATLTDKKAELEIEIEIASGLGFMPVESKKKDKQDIGMIAIDALFSPIRKVNFEVENMRVGDRTDYNRLRFDIETDGSTTAEEAFAKACEILVEQFMALTGEEQIKDESVDNSEANENAESNDDPLKIKVEDLKLATRTLTSLTEGGIKTVGGLVKKTEGSLRELDGMGDKGIAEIKKALKKLGLSLKEE